MSIAAAITPTDVDDGTLDSVLDAIKSELGDSLPRPAGWKLLVVLKPQNTMSEGGIIIPEVVTEREQNAAVAAFVVDMGPCCYNNPAKYGTTPWCQPGDWVLLRPYAGTRFKWRGQIFVFINDDTIEGVVSDPREIRRV